MAEKWNPKLGRFDVTDEPKAAQPQEPPFPPCADCGHVRDDSHFHFDAPGTNWGAALHWFKYPAAPPAPQPKPATAIPCEVCGKPMLCGSTRHFDCRSAAPSPAREPQKLCKHCGHKRTEHYPFARCPVATASGKQEQFEVGAAPIGEHGLDYVTHSGETAVCLCGQGFPEFGDFNAHLRAEVRRETMREVHEHISRMEKPWPHNIQAWLSDQAGKERT